MFHSIIGWGRSGSASGADYQGRPAKFKAELPDETRAVFIRHCPGLSCGHGFRIVRAACY
jgi:hypothetical protein